MLKMTRKKFDTVKQIAEQIPNLNNDAEFVASQKKLELLRESLKQVIVKLNNCRPGPCEPRTLTTVEVDAQQILNGGDVESLAGQSAENRRDSLIRQKLALEMAIKSQEQIVIKAQLKAVQQGCKEIKPVAQPYIERIIESFLEVEKSLKSAEEFFSLLADRGFRPDWMDPAYKIWPFERQVESGCLTTLEFYLRMRRKSIGIEESKKI